MSARPLVQVQPVRDGQPLKSVQLPTVFLTPIRSDIVQFVHTNMAKNKRQPYAVSNDAGHQHSAESWGTGRAVARIPRVSGGGTHRAGQGAFGNMCRKGRMFAPTKTWRRWHRRINKNQRRYAVASALAASALPALVLARGHRIGKIAEVPLVINNSVESITKTKDAINVLKRIKALADVQKVKRSKKLRAGQGKLRNRRFTQRRGPLIIYKKDSGIVRAFRNIPGVELLPVRSMNLLQLAPGGHLGRFIIWTQGAFEYLNKLFGTEKKGSKTKKGYTLPKPLLSNADLQRLVNSDEVQNAIRPAKARRTKPAHHKKNPLNNLGVLLKLNPYAKTLRRRTILASQKKKTVTKAQKAEVRKKKKAGHAHYKKVLNVA
jgi:large subunit ribosomal protein L4e